MKKGLLAALVLGGATIASPVAAHIRLTSPPTRHPNNNNPKDGPCGIPAPDGRGTDPSRIMTFTAGETITVTWIEYIDHDPSHYRIAFSKEGDVFADPVGYDDQTTEYPELLDGIPDADAGGNHEYSVQVTLPNEPCDSCTLQLIQVMHDKPPWGPAGGDDIYYECADIVIVADPDNPDPPVDPPIGQGGESGGPAAGSGGFGAPTGTGGAGQPGATGGTGTAPTDPNDSDSSSDGGGEGLKGGCTLENSRSSAPSWALFTILLGALAGARRRRSQHS